MSEEQTPVPEETPAAPEPAAAEEPAAPEEPAAEEPAAEEPAAPAAEILKIDSSSETTKDYLDRTGVVPHLKACLKSWIWRGARSHSDSWPPTLRL